MVFIYSWENKNILLTFVPLVALLFENTKVLILGSKLTNKWGYYVTLSL